MLAARLAFFAAHFSGLRLVRFLAGAMLKIGAEIKENVKRFEVDQPA
jgi:hypothetical protein